MLRDAAHLKERANAVRQSPRGLGLAWSLALSASHAALWTACHGVRSHPEPAALGGECSIPVV